MPGRNGESQGDQILVSPNAQGPPSVDQLRHLADQYSDPPLAVDGNTLRYSTNKFPFLGFFMPRPRCEDRLLYPLRYSYKGLPVITVRGTWRLSPALVKQWQELENNLLAFNNMLFTKLGLYVPLEFTTFPLPRTYGYDQVRLTEGAVRCTANRARNAFNGLLATSSWLISMTKEFKAEIAPWFQKLSLEYKDKVQWLHELAISPIAHFEDDNGRIGVVVTPDCQFLEYIPRFVEAHVPVWLVWNKPEDYTGTKCAQYKPDPAVVCYGQHHKYRKAAISLSSPPPVGVESYLSKQRNVHVGQSTTNLLILLCLIFHCLLLQTPFPPHWLCPQNHTQVPVSYRGSQCGRLWCVGHLKVRRRRRKRVQATVTPGLPGLPLIKYSPCPAERALLCGIGSWRERSGCAHASPGQRWLKTGLIIHTAI